MTKEWLEHNIPKETEGYFCGVVPFMKGKYQNLRQIGISDDKNNFEMFQPGVDI